MSPLRDYLLLQDRDRIPYEPGEACIEQVRRIVTEAGHDAPAGRDVGLAYVDLRHRDPASAPSLGDVAEHVIGRRAHRQGNLFT